MVATETVAGNLHDQIKPAKATPLNGYSSLRRNLYVLSYSPEGKDFLDGELAEYFNLIHLYFDIQNSCKVPYGPEIIMRQLIDIVKADNHAIILGHSCNGYIAHQLAAVLPQISHCVIVDAFNEFKHEDYVRRNFVKSLTANLYRQVIENKDPGYPLSLIRYYLRSFHKRRMTYDLGVLRGAECFYQSVRNYPAINHCIFFRATRSSMSNPNHGPNWRPYVSGEFHLIPIKANHVEIWNRSKEIAGHIIRIVLKSDKTDCSIPASGA